MIALIHCQFEDAYEDKIIAIFGAPQDPGIWPNMGVVSNTDDRYAEFYNTRLDALGQSVWPSPAT